MSPFSATLKRPPPKGGLLKRLVGGSQPVPGSFAYLLLVTRAQPGTADKRESFLYEIAETFFGSHPGSRESCKYGCLFETGVADIGELVNYARCTAGARHLG